MQSVVIFTDGSCERNPGGPGSWAAVILIGEARFEISGRCDEPTTSNRMEITAAIQALSFIREPSKVLLQSDSSYLVKGASSWLGTWAKRGWTRKDKATKKRVPVLNVDLWREIYRLMKFHRVTWKHVPGHANCAENNRCDALAYNESIKRHQGRAQQALV